MGKTKFDASIARPECESLRPCGLAGVPERAGIGAHTVNAAEVNNTGGPGGIIGVAGGRFGYQTCTTIRSAGNREINAARYALVREGRIAAVAIAGGEGKRR